MSIEISPAHNLMKQAMDYRAIRQDMIASNIANADTPFYRPRDFDFETMLQQKSQEAYGERGPQLQMARTNAAHLEPESASTSLKATTFYRDGHGARNDGNSVDLDVESTEMSKNATMFNALTSAFKKSSFIFKSVIEASEKTQ